MKRLALIFLFFAVSLGHADDFEDQIGSDLYELSLANAATLTCPGVTLGDAMSPLSDRIQNASPDTIAKLRPRVIAAVTESLRKLGQRNFCLGAMGLFGPQGRAVLNGLIKQ